MENNVNDFENPSLAERRNNELNEYRKIGKFTDLVLESTDSKTMKVHKSMISASCPYFRGMFNHDDFIETKQDLIKLTDDVNFESLEIIMEYLYTGKAQVLNENSENLYRVAQFLELNELKEFCSDVMVKNISLENCLNDWRNSVTYFNDKVTNGCIDFIVLNIKQFFNTSLSSLTFEELKLICTNRDLLTIDEENLYKYLMTWVKYYLDERKTHLVEFIDFIKFDQISDKFFEMEVMSDEILKTDIEFSNKILVIAFKKLMEKTEKLEKNKPICSYNDGIVPEKLHLISNCGAYQLNIEERKWTKEMEFSPCRPKHFSSAGFKKDIFILGGNQSNQFGSVNLQSKKTTNHSCMIEKRSEHKSIQLNGNIFSCGGYTNNGSVEIFDINLSKWSIGPKMNDSKYLFGIETSDNSIFTFGGLMNKVGSNKVERLDPREGKWKIISTEEHPQITSVCLFNKTVFCMDAVYGRKVFDLRTNSWSDDRLPDAVKSKIQYYCASNDIAEFNGQIYGVFQNEDSTTWGTFVLDELRKKWEDLKIPIYFDDSTTNIQLFTL